MKLRPAGMEDAGVLLEWRNDPVTRKMSLDTGEVGLPEHEAWLSSKLADPSCEIWIAELDDMPIAQVRLDRVDPTTAVISVALAPEARGQGHAGDVLAGALAAQRLGVTQFRATVRAENRASLALFERAGFSVARREDTVVHFERSDR